MPISEGSRLRDIFWFALFVAICVLGSWFAVKNPEIWNAGIWPSVVFWLFFGFVTGAVALMLKEDLSPLEEELQNWGIEPFCIFFYCLFAWIWPMAFSVTANLTRFFTAFSWLTTLQIFLCFIASASTAAFATWFMTHLRKRQIEQVITKKLEEFEYFRKQL